MDIFEKLRLEMQAKKEKERAREARQLGWMRK